MTVEVNGKTLPTSLLHFQLNPKNVRTTPFKTLSGESSQCRMCTCNHTTRNGNGLFRLVFFILLLFRSSLQSQIYIFGTIFSLLIPESKEKSCSVFPTRPSLFPLLSSTYLSFFFVFFLFLFSIMWSFLLARIYFVDEF